jgi:ATP-dependent helicase/nuclease subunit B
MSSSALLRSLAQATGEFPLERKLLVCSGKAQGRELLRALTMAGTPWLGWEVTTPWLLALDLVHQDVAERGELMADEFRIMRLVDESIEAVVAAGHDELRAALDGVSFRDAVHRAIALLRNAPHGIDGGAVDGRILRATLEVLADYERRLAESKLLDRAAVLRRALEHVQLGARPFAGAQVWLLPATRYGLRGELLAALLNTGAAQLLQSEPVHGLDLPPGLLRQAAQENTKVLSYLHAPSAVRSRQPLPESSAAEAQHGHGAAHASPSSSALPSLQLFAAATPLDELREVLRRVVAQNLPWDQVEIIATDARTYGNALYALARKLGIPLTMANGIDLARTRTGRAVRGYLAWLRDAFPAEGLRILLEAGDIAARDAPGASGARLGYRLRLLRIGWGKQRYYETMERALRAALAPAAPDDQREAQDAEAARERERAELRALRDIIIPILDAAPDAPPRLGAEQTLHAPAHIARGLLAFLDHAAAGDENDAAVRGLVRERLERAAAELTRPTSWESALAIIERCADTRVSADDDGAAAWTSAPGRLHFSDLRNGGHAQRAHTFVVGLDASRVAANAGVDPILTDSARGTVLGLPTARERAALRRYELAELLAGLPGSVTLSFSAWDATEGRAVPPAMEMLQALRLLEGNAGLTYSDLHHELGILAGAVPQGAGLLDTGDVWLSALSSASGVLHSALHVVEAAYPHLQRGQQARRARQETRFTAYHGKLRRNASAQRVFSATALEALGTCPRRYLYRYIFRIEPPEFIDFDPERWLDPLERGSLLHRTYELTLLRARERALDYQSRAFWELAADVLRESIALTRDRLPPPGEEVLQREVRDLADDLRRFVKMIRKLQPEWIELEYRFGEGQRPLILDTALGPLRLRGAIDRIDQLEDGRLQVIDYKTGRKYGYWPARPFNGGRRIQHVVYSLAAARLLEREVARMEYHFPTLRGENEIVPYWPRQLGAPEEALLRLHRIAAGDTFPTTDDPRDCRFCDFAPVCRAVPGEFGGADSPPAKWMKEHGLELPDAEALRVLRRVDG